MSSPTAIDLFAGGGGTALGLEKAGFKHLLVNEKAKDPAATLRHNRPDWNVVHADISTIDFKEYDGKVDLVEGGFPCQAFSYAGKRAGLQDARGTLFYQFARAIDETKPAVALGENVKGLLTHDKGNTFRNMVSVLESIGYKVSWKVMDASQYNVPQKRERLILAAVREDIDKDYVFPEPLSKIPTVREALREVPQSSGQQYNPAKAAVMALVPEGSNWRSLPLKTMQSYMGGAMHSGGGRTGFARRLAWDKPAPTLLCSPSQKSTELCHPEETRPLTVREYARIQTFPDNWELQGIISSQYKQIGNAVPVNLAYYIGLAARNLL